MPRTNTINCPNATSPVNISMDSIMGPCVLKCDYNYNYGDYVPNISNNKSYLSLNYSGKMNPVKYNDDNYNVQEIRIYHPSLHTYNGARAAGEMFIIHNGPGKNLIVSIPIVVGGKTNKGSVLLASVISEAAQRIPNDGESVTLSMGNFSLDAFIPANKGYFSYTGTLPYQPCNGTYNYVVYNIDDALNVPVDNMNQLEDIITTTNCMVKTNNDTFYNKNGANAKNNSDEIFIDCQPVNSEGELLVNMNQSNESNYTTPEFDFEKIAPFLYVIIGAIAAYGIVYTAKTLFTKLRKTD